MKILKLRFKNLNSLYGEWSIDFTDPAYSNHGIFAMTGPTGAGKSTILDAICLALYGATPRLGKITASQNEIMSRQTGECFAEVLFETRSGRFHCHWQQHRSRKNAEGALQQPKHEIAEGGDSGKIIESQLRGVQAAVERITGMDFERFTRSILLAQGGFDTFLKAGAEDKSKILEQITGTAIYTEISKLVHERNRQEKEQLKLFKASVSGIEILTEDEESELKSNCADKLVIKEEKAKQVESSHNAITWLKRKGDLQKEIKVLSERKSVVHADIKAFEPKAKQLSWAKKAVVVAGVYGEYQTVQKQAAGQKAALKLEQDKRPVLEEAAKAKQAMLQQATENYQAAKKNQDEVMPLITQVREKDTTIAIKQKAMLDSEQEELACQSELSALSDSLAAEQKRIAEKQQTLKAIDAYLLEHAEYEHLGLVLEKVNRQHDKWKESDLRLDQQQGQLKQLQGQLDAAHNEVVLATQTHQKSVKEQQKVQAELLTSKSHLDELLQGRRTEELEDKQEALIKEINYINRIVKLEAHRKHLEDGEPCPLCGATEHPLAEDDLPEPDAIEIQLSELKQLINKIKMAEVQHAELEQKWQKLEDQMPFVLKEKARAEQAAKDLENRKQLALKDIEGLKTSLASASQAMVEIMAPYKGIGFDIHEIDQIQGILKDKAQHWQSQKNKKVSVQEDIIKLDKKLEVLKTRQKGLQGDLDKLRLTQSENLKVLEKLKAERQDLFGDKDTQKEQDRLQQATNQAEQVGKEARNNRDLASQAAEKCKTLVESIEQALLELAEKIEDKEKSFKQALSDQGMVDEADFLSKLLDHDTIQAIESEASKLKNAETEVRSLLSDRQNRLSELESQQLTHKPLDELEEAHEAFSLELKSITELANNLQFRLKANEENKSKLAGKQAEITKQSQECELWGQLHELIGSNDGKKFRNFAQGLTFEMMVNHANRQLEKMTDRYLLIRDDAEPLVLNVVDNYQAGEIRSTKNLSGGECFIVSLTLALGLSKMASKQVNIDSLFLDEGFGTLDNDSLEMALETLSSLQHEGKLIGVISHVTELKNRIGTQIKVAPVSGGRSRINGPGVNF